MKWTDLDEFNSQQVHRIFGLCLCVEGRQVMTLTEHDDRHVVHWLLVVSMERFKPRLMSCCCSRLLSCDWLFPFHLRCRRNSFRFSVQYSLARHPLQHRPQLVFLMSFRPIFVSGERSNSGWRLDEQIGYIQAGTFFLLLHTKGTVLLVINNNTKKNCKLKSNPYSVLYVVHILLIFHVIFWLYRSSTCRMFDSGTDV